MTLTPIRLPVHTMDCTAKADREELNGQIHHRGRASA